MHKTLKQIASESPGCTGFYQIHEATKPEQWGLFSLICLEVVYEQTCAWTIFVAIHIY